MGLFSYLMPCRPNPRATRLQVVRPGGGKMLIAVATTNGGSRSPVPLYGRLDRMSFFKELNRVYYRGHDWRIL